VSEWVRKRVNKKDVQMENEKDVDGGK